MSVKEQPDEKEMSFNKIMGELQTPQGKQIRGLNEENAEKMDNIVQKA